MRALILLLLLGVGVAVAQPAPSGINPVNFAAQMLVWFNSLPTSLPASSGVLWNNGGVLSQS